MNVIREIDGAINSNRERKYIYRDIKAPDNIAVINLFKYELSAQTL